MLKQSLLQKLNQTLNPQQLILVKLLSVPTIDLETRIKEELEENPALDEGREEEDFDAYAIEDEDFDQEHSREDFDLDPYLDDDEVPSYKTTQNNGVPEETSYQIADQSQSMVDTLKEQLSFLPLDLDATEEFICHYIIGNLNEDGFLMRDIESITDDLAFRFNINVTDAKVLQCLKYVQSLEPVGIGALSLQDCLLLQLEQLPDTKPVKIAVDLVKYHFEDLVKHNHNKIFRKINPEYYKLGKAVIEKLNPSPASIYNTTHSANRSIIPDFYLIDDDGNLSIALNDRNNIVLSVNKDYKQMLNTYKNNAEAQNFVRGKVQEAQWFIDALHLRTLSMMAVMEVLLKHQYQYLASGDKTLIRPLILKDVADEVQLDISTVSRIVSQKYIDTSFGIIPLKQLFSEAIPTDGGTALTQNIVFDRIQTLIEQEDKNQPYTDEMLERILKEKYQIMLSRRTISKYREQLDIPPAKFRKIIL